MSELRKDPVSGAWCVIATERGKRPSDFAAGRREGRRAECPFCYGNEHLTPPEVLAYRNGSQPDTPGWSVRVVPNKFPAFSGESAERRPERLGPYFALGAGGSHEVLVESPVHDSTLGSHDVEQVVLILRALRDRISAFRASSSVEYVQAFKNHGAAAGASLEHAHFQIIATPLVPEAVTAEAERFGAGNGGCALCRAIEYELREGSRIVEDSDDFISMCPYASRFPYEMWIVPRAHQGSFDRATERDLRALAPVLKRTVARLEAALDHPPYNLVLHTAAFRMPGDWFHWHVEIVPRLVVHAGFELGTGWYINPTPPEMAARYLGDPATLS
ncbi:MAG: DUF4921 family protein, partial [Firmicutes bacterium]|nr:DUF4921 family protein [Bacillota bacterium]